MPISEISAFFLAHALLIKFMLLLVILALLLLAERIRPYRRTATLRLRRSTNLLLAGIASAAAASLIWVVPALAAVAVADFAAQQNFGLLNLIFSSSPLSAWEAGVSFIITLVALDCALYWQHRISHVLPWLWKLHRVHHSDTAFDVTLGLRFHPGEIVLSLLYKSAVVLILGAPVVAVLMYELLLMSMALFTHANIALPDRLERRLGRWLITPELHRVHHSIDRVETNSNYGNWLSIWDRLFKSAAARRADSASMPIGLVEYRAADAQTLGALLLNPLQRKH